MVIETATGAEVHASQTYIKPVPRTPPPRRQPRRGDTIRQRIMPRLSSAAYHRLRTWLSASRSATSTVAMLRDGSCRPAVLSTRNKALLRLWAKTELEEHYHLI